MKNLVLHVQARVTQHHQGLSTALVKQATIGPLERQQVNLAQVTSEAVCVIAYAYAGSMSLIVSMHLCLTMCKDYH